MDYKQKRWDLSFSALLLVLHHSFPENSLRTVKAWITDNHTVRATADCHMLPLFTPRGESG